MTNPKLALIPSGYKATKVYSILPSDGGGDFTFDRASEGTRVRKDGLIEEVTDDVPRLDWSDGNCPSLLLEPERTNYALNNTQLQLNSTLTSSGTITMTGNYASAPDGTLTATRIEASATGSGYALLSVNGTDPSVDGDGGGYYISTIYVKSNTGQNQTCAFYGASSGSPKTRAVTTEWTRIQFTGYRPANSKYSYIGVAINNGSDEELDFLVWGGQTELVDSYPTSLIYTETGAVTRFKDECINAGDSDLFNITEGVLYAEIKALADDGTNRNIALSDSSTSNRIVIVYTSVSNQIRFYLEGSGGTITVNHTLTDVSNFVKVAIKYKPQDFSFYVNGVEVDTNTSNITFSGLNDLSFYNPFGGGTSNFYGNVKDLRYYDTALTDAELTELTT